MLLAPMEDVSDPPFRHLCKKYGADMLYTEFISADGLIRDAEKSVKKLDIFDDERPVGIQIFGGEEGPMMRSAEIVEEAKPELLDINYGCPVKNVVCRNAGAGILRDIDKMVALTAAIVKSTKLPVTVKTRLGWDGDSIKIIEVAERLQDVGIQAISIHCRTKHQMYTGKADWNWIARVKENPRLKIPVFGNGDIDTPEKAVELIKKYNADGVMIGRSALGRPWLVGQIAHGLDGEQISAPSASIRLEAAIEHYEGLLLAMGVETGIRHARKHIAAYAEDASQLSSEDLTGLRQEIVTSTSPSTVIQLLTRLYQSYPTRSAA